MLHYVLLKIVWLVLQFSNAYYTCFADILQGFRQYFLKLTAKNTSIIGDQRIQRADNLIIPFILFSEKQEIEDF